MAETRLASGEKAEIRRQNAEQKAEGRRQKAEMGDRSNFHPISLFVLQSSIFNLHSLHWAIAPRLRPQPAPMSPAKTRKTIPKAKFTTRRNNESALQP
ncbi:MAG: hypothetical protein ACFB8W_20930 [Elainellaceae cyanobacterium]